MARKKFIVSQGRGSAANPPRPRPAPLMNSELEVDIYFWVSEEVKGMPSTITQEELDNLRESRIIFDSDLSNLYIFSVPEV
ncbi:hypothetical protein AHAS_Ahas01G0139900 [Arachis hypogaea]